MNRCFPRMLARLWALALYGLVMAGALPVAGQGPGRLPFREFGNREGMLSSAINAIHQDGRGLLWVGTEVGLHRYDGHSFQLLELPLPDTTVFSLASEADRLWVGTRGGLLLLGPEGPRPLPQGLPGDRRPVSHLQTDPQGQVWFLVSGVPWRGTAGLVAPAGALPPGTTAAALYVDPVDGAALVCDRHRLWAFQEGRWQAVSAPPRARNEKLLAIAREGDGTLWLRTTSGAWSRPGPKPWGFHPLAPAGGYPVITGLGRCRDGSVWLASGEALLKVAGGRWDRIADPLFGAIGVAFQDQEGSLWIGAGNLFQMMGQGLWRHWNRSTGLPSPLTWQVLQDSGGRCWAASDGGLALGTVEGWRTLVRGRFRRAGSTRDGYLWAARADLATLYRVAPGGLDAQPVQVPETLPKGSPIDSFAASGQDLWLLSEDHLWRGAATAGRLRWQAQPHLPVGSMRSLLEDGRGGLYLAGDAGLMAREGTGWVRAEGLPPHAVLSLALASDGTLAAGFGDSGALLLLHRQGGAWRVGEHLELPRDAGQRVSYALAFDRQNRLWIGTNRGLVRMDPHRDTLPACFEEGEGLGGSDVSHQSLRFDDLGRLWVCTTESISRFEVEAEPPPLPMLAPVLLSASGGGRSLPLGSAWTLQAGARLQAHFVLPSYLHPDSQRFLVLLQDGHGSYTLELHQPWLDLPSLGARAYQVTLLGQAPGGRRSPGTLLRIRVRPPPWSSNWAIAGYLAVLTAAGLGLHLLRQAHLRQRTQALERLVAQRTAELVLASEAKSRFVATMSHELRTPLNAILLYSELLQEEAPTAGARDASRDAAKIHGAGQHLLGVIENILDLSRIEAGRMTLELQEVDLAPFLADLEAALRPLIEKADNTFRLSLDPGLVQIRTDPMRLRQILSNLLGNAAKFTKGGEVDLTVKGEGRKVLFQVRDTGIGMTELQSARVFEPFVQADASTTRRFGGSGLGLALVRELSIFLGGTVHLESQIGQGSTFTVTLPRSG